MKISKFGALALSVPSFLFGAAAAAKDDLRKPVLAHTTDRDKHLAGLRTHLPGRHPVQKDLRRLRELSSFDWEQVGADIDGEAAGDQSGYSVAMSSDGNRIAIGAYLNDGTGLRAGHVRVFDLNTEGNWVQVGADIDGEAAGDWSGNSVAMSSNGNRVAIGAIYNAGNGSSAGHVRVFDLNTEGDWVQVGLDIDGEAAGDWSGNSVAMSSNGNRIAIGAYLNDGNGLYAGHVRIFEVNTEGNWVQVGLDIDGEAAYDQSGRSVAMSNDGNRIAIGAIFNAGNGSSAGHVRVFDLNTEGDWVQVGLDIYGEAAGDWSGNSVAMSSDGNRIAIGAFFNDGNGSSAGHVRVFHLNTEGDWVQVGLDIDGEAARNLSGRSVAMSSNGNRVAIGADSNDGNGPSAGHVRVFDLNTEGDWVQVGADIEGEAAYDQSGSSVAMSSDGNRIAIGANDNDGNGNDAGHVRIYEFLGFVTGGGWIQSPAGAYEADDSLEGRASFRFVSKYKKGRSVPEGNTQFTFQAADLNFHSTSYEWLVITGSDCAKYKGLGMINEIDGYGFMLTACDVAGPGVGRDTFRIKIWSTSDDSIIYDNQMGELDDSDGGTEISGGNIKVHSG